MGMGVSIFLTLFQLSKKYVFVACNKILLNINIRTKITLIGIQSMVNMIV